LADALAEFLGGNGVHADDLVTEIEVENWHDLT
jgi:hypothetical protein